MSFALKSDKHLEVELRAIVRRELRKTVRVLRGADTGFDKVVYESRKSLKKVRAVVDLFRQLHARPRRKDRKRLKATAAVLSRLRDSAATIETLDDLRRRDPSGLPEHTYAIVRGMLATARERLEVQARDGGTVAKAAERLAKVRRSAKRWSAPSLDAAEMIEVVTESYRRSRRSMGRADATHRSAALHNWRKDLKTLLYQLRLVKPLIAGVAGLADDLKRLQAQLGDDHDLVVLAATLRACPDLRPLRREVREIERLAARVRHSARRRALALGRRLHARKGREFADWLRASVTIGERQQRVA